MDNKIQELEQIKKILKWWEYKKDYEYVERTMEKGFYGIDHVIEEFTKEIEKSNNQYSVQNWIKFLKKYADELEKILFKFTINITGTIKDNENNKVTKFTLKTTSQDEVYADDIIKALSKVGLNGDYKIEKDL